MTPQISCSCLRCLESYIRVSARVHNVKMLEPSIYGSYGIMDGRREKERKTDDQVTIFV